MGDFLKKDVETSLGGRFLAAGLNLRIDTNSERILAIANTTLQTPDSDNDTHDVVRLRLWVEDIDLPQQQERKPLFRGLGHLVFCGYNDRSSLVVNLRDRYAAGRFTQSLASDTRFWKTILFPSLLGIVGPSLGLTSLHSACVAWKGNGLLLVGGSSAGKSTLSLALAQSGLDFIGDDRTLVSFDGGKLRAHALSSDVKLRSEAVRYFPAVESMECREMWAGDTVLRFDPVERLGVNRAHSCEPRWVVVLERDDSAAFSLESITPHEAAFRLQQDLHQESPDATARQRRTIEALAGRPCYRLRYGGDPHAVAGSLFRLFFGNGVAPASRPSETRLKRAPGPAADPLRRFSATCLRHDVLLMGRHLRIETDSELVIRRVTEAFGPSEQAMATRPRFLWRIVSEPREICGRTWPAITAFAHGTLRYIAFGPAGFAAADLEAREAVAVLPSSLCEDEIGFSTIVLAGLLHLSAPALRLTPLSAACVARGRNGLLLFGSSNSGKTTATYWAKKLGLEFHSDQATFLEFEAGSLQAWGDFWPAAFRPETAQYVPEISTLGRPFQYCDRTFLCIDREALSGTGRGKVTPAACIFLERRAASPPRLIPLSHWEFQEQIFASDGSKEDQRLIFGLLGRVPAYRLLYDDDPSIAARFFRSVLDAHELMEHRA
jgi:hypothetical protein